MDLTMVRERIGSDERADELIRLIAFAESVATDRAARNHRRGAKRTAWITGGTAAALVAGGLGVALTSRGNDEKPADVPVPPTLGPARTVVTTPTVPSTVSPTTTALANAPVGTAPATSMPATTVVETTAVTTPAAG